MVEDSVRSGKRIAQLLSSELDGRSDGAHGALTVTNADTDAAGTTEGERAYDVAHEAFDGPLARVFVHEDRIRVEVLADAADAAGHAEAAGFAPRPAPGPRTVFFVESGAAVKWAADVFDAVAAGVVE